MWGAPAKHGRGNGVICSVVAGNSEIGWCCGFIFLPAHRRTVRETFDLGSHGVLGSHEVPSAFCGCPAHNFNGYIFVNFAGISLERNGHFLRAGVTRAYPSDALRTGATTRMPIVCTVSHA